MQRVTQRLKKREICPIRTVITISLYFKSLYVLLTLYPVSVLTFLYSLVAFVPILFFTSVSHLFRDKISRNVLLIVHSVISFLLFADVLYFRGFGHLINFYMIFARGISDGMGASVLSLIRPLDLMLLIDLPILIYFCTKYKIVLLRPRVRVFLAVSVLSGFIMLTGIRQLEYHKVLGDLKNIPLFMSPLGSHVYDLYRQSRERNFAISPEEIQMIGQWHEDNQKFQEPSPRYAGLDGILAGKNLIIIQFESLENFVIGREFYGQEITPNINRLLDRSLYFSSVMEQVKDGNSSDAELLFNTSLYPIQKGSAFLRFGDNEYNSLPRILDRQGYTSIVLHGDDREFWNRHTVFPNLGFDRYIDETQFASQEDVGLGILDEHLFDQALLEMKTLAEPFNTYLITVTSHMPFNMPKAYEKLVFPVDDTSTDYLQSIHYVDEAFGEFYQELNREGILEDAVIVIYGDHEGVHKYYETDLPDNEREVPFIIHAPGIRGMEIAKPAGQIDMMPTLLYLLGVDRGEYAHTVMGRNLFSRYTGSAMLSSGEIIHADGVSQLERALHISDITIRSNYFRDHRSGAQADR